MSPDLSAPRPAPVVVKAGRRRGFGLDSPLPADPATVEAQVLRLLAAMPDVIAIRPSDKPDRPHPPGHRGSPAFVPGTPDILVLRPGGQTACLRIRAQADKLSRDQMAFADLCRQRAIPYAVVRSLDEARAALQRFGVALPEVRS